MPGTDITNGGITENSKENTLLYSRLLFIMIVVAPIVTLIVTYPIDIVFRYEGFIPTISGTIDYSPTSNIGTLGLGITVILMLLIFSLKFQHTNAWLETMLDETYRSVTKKRMWIVNIVCYIIGILASLGLLGVISFQAHLVGGAHGFFATMFFSLVLVHMIIQLFIDHKLEIISRRMKFYRLTICILCLISLLFFLFFGISDDVVYISVSSIFEAVASIAYLFYYSSCFREFENSLIVFKVQIQK
ncbi:hypothetical protein DLAC_11333 [Tieghemostelium lacteum]|uniref:CWH43-like N-terminal domain-containing protein n=1 Tax=Tieghemostelium lacteum TaxID=361077 RepID=A0A151Z468_TIELA|nr:hypothetical protein DLAC_11333 [Tieghemostelium lacteum]|eukprot:KYQ88594.1 hypothetical protein DLAC_11333 [Tieghemostelium lacteum]